jgi:CheY-like chemotaxis protein
MLGGTELALMDLGPGHPARSSLEQVRKTTERATELCRQMLAYSGKGHFVSEPIDLSKLVGGMAHLLEVSIAKKAVLRYDLEKGLPAVEADATQIRQIVLNLLVNASEAVGEDSGTILVSTSVMDCDREYLKSAYLDQDLPEGRYVCLEVADTGCGMDQETMSRLFDPFFTTKFTGRGLGLAATLGIIRGHSGTIKIYSEVGQGTTFKVLLPASVQPVGGAEVESDPDESWVGSGVVLVVDDEEAVRNVVTDMLQRFGFEILLAEDGRKGVELFQSHADEIVLVLLDMTMPHLDGSEAFREMHRYRPDVPIVLASGYNQQDAITRFAGKGLAGFVQKPFRVDVLREAIRGALGEG